MSEYRVLHWGTESDATVKLRLDSTLSEDLSELVPYRQIHVSDGYDQVGFDVDTAEQVARDMLAAVERARTAQPVDFEQARSVAWWHKPWWWGGHGTWWVAPWGMADRDGWLMAVGAKQWLRDRHPLYRPQEDAPLYFVTRTGFPQWCDVDEETIARVVAMTPVGDWPSGVPPPLDRPP